jgi:tetratricopeptide (TPR) repeat protein
MRPPVFRFPSAFNTAFLYATAPVFSLVIAFCLQPPLAAQNPSSALTAKDRMHDSAQWVAVEQHLPNRLTSSPQVLESEGDILRARRLPEDAMDYYNFAFQNGGDAATLMNKLGLMALELEDVPWARAYFKRVVKLDPQSADGWNNLGTVEYMTGRPAYAVADYARAVKLDAQRADLRCNLAAAYFDVQDYEGARKEMAAALRLDPEAFDRIGDGSATATQVFSADGRGRLSFEMARIYARRGAEEQTLHALAMASEAGFDVQRAIRHDGALLRYVNDPRIDVMTRNAQALRTAGRIVEGATPTGSTPADAATKPTGAGDSD